MKASFPVGTGGWADVVERAYRKGATFASWMDFFRLEPWLEAMEECGLKAETFTGARDIEGLCRGIT